MDSPLPTADVAIVGAGAAGLATAIFTRRANPSRAVVLLDGARTPGAKILVSGGSRCNVTNTVVLDRDFWGGRAPIVRRVLRAFPAAQTVAFFRGLGVTLREEADGKLFPVTNRARDVLEALLRETSAVGATLISSDRVVAVERIGGTFRVSTAHGHIEARAVVLATGGQSLPKSGSDGAGFAIARGLGHTIVATTPALAPLVLDPSTSFHRELAGVSHDAEMAVWIDGRVAIRLAGALLWTHVGVSGPLALNASRHWMRGQIERRPVAVTLSFCPGRLLDEVDDDWTRRAAERSKASLQTMVASMVPASVASALLARLRIDGSRSLAHVEREDRRRLVRALVEWPLPVIGTRGYNFAEVTAGGVALDEIRPGTMESRVCPGLYLVGEILDVDGRIGGFNFQWAWSSAFVAGRALGARATEPV